MDHLFFDVGDTYLIRQVTTYALGKVRSIDAHGLVLEDACWVPDTGRFSTALATGELREVEMIPPGHGYYVSFGAVVDAHVWTHPLPKQNKPE